MKKDTYFYLSSFVFFAAGILHFWRVVNNWDLTLGSYVIPMWLSWLVIIIAFTLSYNGWRLQKRKR